MAYFSYFTFVRDRFLHVYVVFWNSYVIETLKQIIAYVGNIKWIHPYVFKDDYLWDSLYVGGGMVLPICKGGVWDTLEVYTALYCKCCFVSQSGKTFHWADYDDDEGENESKTSLSPTYTSSPVPSLTSHASKIHVKPAAGDSNKHTREYTAGVSD